MAKASQLQELGRQTEKLRRFRNLEFSIKKGFSLEHLAFAAGLRDDSDGSYPERVSVVNLTNTYGLRTADVSQAVCEAVLHIITTEIADIVDDLKQAGVEVDL